MTETYFFDTNILMYAAGSRHPFQEPCLEILKKAAQGKIFAVTDTETFQEVAYRYWHQNKMEKAQQIFKDYELIFHEIYPVEKKHLAPYYKLLKDYPKLSPRDAIHLAVMQEADIKNIYTADKAFATVKGIKVFQP